MRAKDLLATCAWEQILDSVAMVCTLASVDKVDVEYLDSRGYFALQFNDTGPVVCVYPNEPDADITDVDTVKDASDDIDLSVGAASTVECKRPDGQAKMGRLQSNTI